MLCCVVLCDVVSCCVSDFGVRWDGMTRNDDDLDLMHSQQSSFKYRDDDDHHDDDEYGGLIVFTRD